MASNSEGISWGGIGVRFVMALVLVYATWNPTGTSFTHWVFLPIFGDGAAGTASAQAPLKFLVGMMLVAGWVLYLQATRRSLGAAGALLVAAIGGGVVWLLASWNVLTMQGQAIAHVVLVVLSMILAMGMSWSHLSRRMTGQLDTDAVE
ncbi:MAG: hypothetical protein IPJ11_06860 [Gemmatimonadetes bacterium]|nr:hypothetical protein [Gemmatimonadota bacterium]